MTLFRPFALTLALAALLGAAGPAGAAQPSRKDVDQALLQADHAGLAAVDQASVRLNAARVATASARAQARAARGGVTANQARLASVRSLVKALRNERKAAERIGDTAAADALNVKEEREQRVETWRKAELAAARARLSYAEARRTEAQADEVLAEREAELARWSAYAEVVDHTPDSDVAAGKALSKQATAAAKLARTVLVSQKRLAVVAEREDEAGRLRPDDTTDALLATREDELAATRASLDEATARAVEFEARAAEFEARVVAAETSEAKASARAAEVTARLDHAAADRVAERARAEELERQLSEATDRLAELNAERALGSAGAELDVSLLRAENRAFALQIEELRGRERDALARLAAREHIASTPSVQRPPTAEPEHSAQQFGDLRTRVADLSASLARATERANAAEDGTQLARQEAAAARSEADRLTLLSRLGVDNEGALASAQARAEDSDRAASELRAELRELRLQRAEEGARAEDAHAARQRELESLRAGWERDSSEARSEAERLQERLETALVDRDGVAWRNRELERERGDLSEQASVLGEQVAAGERELAALRAEADARIADVASDAEARVAAELESARQRLGAVQTERDRAVVELAAQKARADDAEHRLQELSTARTGEHAESTTLLEEARAAASSAHVEAVDTERRLQESTRAWAVERAVAARDLEAATERADALKLEAIQARDQLVATRTELREVRSRLDAELTLSGSRSLEQDEALAAHEEEVLSARLALAEAQALASERAQGLARREADLESVRLALAEAERAVVAREREAEQSLGLRDAEIEALQARLADREAARDEAQKRLAAELQQSVGLRRSADSAHQQRRSAAAAMAAEIQLLSDRVKTAELAELSLRASCAERAERVLELERELHAASQGL